jgi:hypothetical protein
MPQTAGLDLSQALPSGNGHDYSDDDFKPGASVSFGNFSLNNTSTTPYILNAPSVTITQSNPSGKSSTFTGQMFYVMGAKDMIYSTATPASNGLFVMNENPLDTLQENSAHQDH